MILDFLGWDEPIEDEFAQDVKIVLASSNFSKELTTAVIWLNQRALDVSCIRIIPYQDNGRILLDVQHVIPLPEAEEFQIRVREKVQRERIEKSEKSNQRLRFLNSLLNTAKQETKTHDHIKPSARSEICYRSMPGPTFFFYVPNQYDSRVEFYLDHYDAQKNKEIFDELYRHKQEIEKSFGEPLIWQRLDDKKASRIRYNFDLGYKADESEWIEAHRNMIDKMSALEKALTPFLD